ncbi:hypothetical protein TRP66_05535 [Pseudomonas sp. JDS28PS106]|uniref:hypothetical protein n=1 Tax=Pseudomonas sp. JDS28PS106 TaxID=2497235 RepID=UPI002FCEC18F
MAAAMMLTPQQCIVAAMMREVETSGKTSIHIATISLFNRLRDLSDLKVHMEHKKNSATRKRQSFGSQHFREQAR